MHSYISDGSKTFFSAVAGWSSIMSRRNISAANRHLKDICKACSSLQPCDTPCILSACLVSLEPDASLRVFPESFNLDDRTLPVNRCPLSTPQDASCTHILVFPTSATTQVRSVLTHGRSACLCICGVLYQTTVAVELVGVIFETLCVLFQVPPTAPFLADSTIDNLGVDLFSSLNDDIGDMSNLFNIADTDLGLPPGSPGRPDHQSAPISPNMLSGEHSSYSAGGPSKVRRRHT